MIAALCVNCDELTRSPLVIYCDDCLEAMAERYRCCYRDDLPCVLGGVCDDGEPA